MTLTKPKTSLDTVGKKEPEPAKKWGNRYDAKKPFTSGSGTHYPAGPHWGLYTWPSRDTAETYAAYIIDWYTRYHPDIGLKWIGAFPLTDSDQ